MDINGQLQLIKIESSGFLAKCSFKSMNILPDANTSLVTFSLFPSSTIIGLKPPEVN